MRTIIGCDPGLSGGFAVISKDGVLIEPMPTEGNVLNLAGIARFLRVHRTDQTMAYLEKVSARPGQGVSSTFKFGRGYGAIEGILTALDIPYVLVTPQRWQKAVWVGCEGSLGPKEKSRITASRLYPGVNFLATPRSRVPHDGMIDALLIAHSGLLLSP